MRLTIRKLKHTETRMSMSWAGLKSNAIKQSVAMMSFTSPVAPQRIIVSIWVHWNTYKIRNKIAIWLWNPRSHITHTKHALRDALVVAIFVTQHTTNWCESVFDRGRCVDRIYFELYIEQA